MLFRECLLGFGAIGLLIACGSSPDRIASDDGHDQAKEEMPLQVLSETSDDHLVLNDQVAGKADDTKSTRLAETSEVEKSRPSAMPLEQDNRLSSMPSGKPASSEKKVRPNRQEKTTLAKKDSPRLQDDQPEMTNESPKVQEVDFTGLPGKALPENTDPVGGEAPSVPAGNEFPAETPTLVVAPSPPPRRVAPSIAVRTENVTSLETVYSTAPTEVTLASGSVIEVRLTHLISSAESDTGDYFEAVLDQDMVTENKTVFQRGSRVRGRLTEVVQPGKVKGRARVTFQLEEIYAGETSYPVVTNAITMEAESTKGKDAAKVGTAVAVGTVLGAIFGGKKGAAIGGASAGGAGSAGVLLSRGQPVEIPAERLFSFRLEEEVVVKLD